MSEEKIVKKFAEVFNIEENLSAAAYEIFIEKLSEKLKTGETLSIPGFGFFNKNSETEIRFIDALREDEDKLFTKIELKKEKQAQFDFDESLLDVGAEKPVANVLDESVVSELESLSGKIEEKLDEFEILPDFDPYMLELTMENETETPEEHETEEDFLEEELEKNIDNANELDTDLQKELEEELLSDFDEDGSEEGEENPEDLTKEEFPNDEEEAATQEESEEEIPEEPEETPEEASENDSHENQIMDEEELNNFLNDEEDTGEESEKEEAKEEKKEEEKKDDKEEDKKSKKKKSLFGFLSFLKKKKKDKGEKEEKEDKKKEDEENGEEEGKKKISKKLLIILIAVFIVITAGGVYYFFFMGNDSHSEEVVEEGHGKSEEGGHGGGEHGEESIEDSLRRHRKHPLTPEEIGEHREASEHFSVDANKPHEKAVNESAPLIETELEDPLSIKEFPHEKKISNTIYYNEGKYMVQISSWKRSSRAIKIVEKLRRYGYNAFIVKAYLPALGGTWYRVRIGFFDTLEDAKEFLRKKEYLNVR